MPKSRIAKLEELVGSLSGARDAPTRFDLYDLQRSIDALADDGDSEVLNKIESLEGAVEALDEKVSNIGKCEACDDLKCQTADLKEQLRDLAQQLDASRAATRDLTQQVRILTRAVDQMGGR